MEENNGNNQPGQELFPLDDAAIEFVERAKKDLEEISRQNTIVNERVNGMLNYFAMVHKLNGRWVLAPNQKELVKAPESQPQPTEQPQ